MSAEFQQLNKLVLVNSHERSHLLFIKITWQIVVGRKVKFLSIMTEIVSLQNDSVVAFIKISVLMFSLTVKTSILLVIVVSWFSL